MTSYDISMANTTTTYFLIVMYIFLLNNSLSIYNFYNKQVRYLQK